MVMNPRMCKQVQDFSTMVEKCFSTCGGEIRHDKPYAEVAFHTEPGFLTQNVYMDKKDILSYAAQRRRSY